MKNDYSTQRMLSLGSVGLPLSDRSTGPEIYGKHNEYWVHRDKHGIARSITLRLNSAY